MPISEPVRPNFLLVGVFCALSPLLAHALQLPTPADPESLALVKRFEADYARVTADPAFFKQPTPPMEWPCEVAKRTLYTSAGVHLALPEEAEKVRLMSRKALRDAGLDPNSAGKGEEYKFIRITPLRAACKEGKLDGEVELLTEYESQLQSTITMPMGAKVVNGTNTTSNKAAKRVTVLFKAGDLKGQIQSIDQIRSTMDMVYDDEQMNAVAARTKVGQPEEPMVLISYSLPETDLNAIFTVSMAPKAGLFSVNWEQQLMSTFSRGLLTQGAPSTVSYKNAALSSITQSPRMTNGKMNGEQIMRVENYLKASGLRLDQVPGMEQARIVTVEGVEMIETRTCFIDGAIVKTTNCPKD